MLAWFEQLVQCDLCGCLKALWLQHHIHKYALIQSSASFLRGDKEEIFGVNIELADSSSLNVTLHLDGVNSIIPWARMEISSTTISTDKKGKSTTDSPTVSTLFPQGNYAGNLLHSIHGRLNEGQC
jgi:hypothetical protein